MTIKVAHITTSDISLHDLLLSQICYLRDVGYEVVGVSSPGPYTPAIEAAGIPHISVTMTRNLTPLADLASLVQLYWIMRRERFTIVHTHTPKAGLLGQLAARLARVPIVVNTVHGFYFHEHMPAFWRRLYISTEKLAARCSDLILSQNREDIQVAVREKICQPELIKHLGNGIDLTSFEPDRYSEEQVRREKEAVGIPLAAPVVGFVGRLAGTRKGFLSFLASGREIHQHIPETCFLVVGEADRGKADAVSPEVAADYGLEAQCRFLGRRPNSAMPLLYRMMDVLVLPSLFEGIPRVLMEAAAMRVPTVATDVKGNREVVEHGRNGLLVPLGDVLALRDGIIELLTDSDKARRMGEEGRRIALERFDQRRVFQKTQTEYARLLLRKGLEAPTCAEKRHRPDLTANR